MDKVILHSDLNNFYASVECLLRPELRGLPVAVSGNPEKRHGIILAKNQLAKSFDVKTGETILEAQRKCPEIVFVPAHHDKYDEFSKVAKEVYYRYTDRIEPFGLDECWLDVTGSRLLFGDGKKIAERIREDIKQTTGGLTVSIGVSFTKTFAKLGSDMKKPDAVTVIDRENYQKLAWSVPIRELMYVGHSTVKLFDKLNIKTIGDLARTGDEILLANLGVNGVKLKQTALGMDDDKVALFRIKEPPKSVGHGTTTFKDITDNETAKMVIYSLADMVAARLRKYGMFANGVALGIRDNNLRFLSRQTGLDFSTQSGKIIAEAAFKLFTANHVFPSALPVRALSVSTFHLTEERQSQQMDLFFNTEKAAKPERLEKTVDKLRERYGHSAVTRAGYMKNEYVLDVFSEDDESLPFYRG